MYLLPSASLSRPSVTLSRSSSRPIGILGNTNKAQQHIICANVVAFMASSTHAKDKTFKCIMQRYIIITSKLRLSSSSFFFCATVRSYLDNGNSNTQWSRLPYFNENKTQTYHDDENASTKDRLQRLGYTTGYGTGYPGGTGISAYNPIKLDLGGVVLGTLVGLGVIIIIPKLLSALHGGYTGYGRSETDNDLSSLSSLMTKIDDILGQNNIDSTTCMQRAICTYVRSTEYNMKTGASDQLDEFIHMLSNKQKNKSQ
uniref:Uncharacterized protein n=1 Tax=Glossina pallidipes TaxID=7398 RepID=A0A1A9ZF73_GLOPL